MIEDRNKLNHQIVCDFLVNKYIDRISGNEKEILLGKVPQEIVFVGMLKPHNEINMSNTNKIFESIPSISVIFYMKEVEKAIINLQITGNFYYSVKPTYEDEISYILKKYSIKYNQEFKTKDDFKKYIKENNCIIEDEIIVKYKRIKIEDFIEPIEINLNEIDNKKLNRIINDKISKFVQENTDDSIAIRRIKTSIDELLNKDIFDELIRTNAKANSLKYSLNVDLKKNWLSNGLYEYKIILTNVTNKLDENYISYDSTFYNAGLRIFGNECKFENIDLNCMVKDYDETEIKALVENASYDYDSEKNIIQTLNIPITYEKRVKTVDKFNKYITFENLYKDPVNNLKNILRELKEDYNEKFDYQKHINKENIDRYNEELRIYEMEINNFSYGIDLIENIQNIQQAFKYMNLTFKNNSKYPGWRLFQIVFVVSEISSIVYSEYKGLPLFKDNNIDNVDLLYFSTGGGKTEAFLGCVIFNLFFDRLRGKNGGITAIIKYPLRLLSVQQLERVLKIIVKANEILEENIPNAKKFDVGYFVGGQNTLNKVDNKIYEEMQNCDEKTFQEKYKLIEVCPRCKEKNVKAYFSKDKWKLYHKCSSCDYEVPIHVIDDEIYRYLPSVIVSTIDKLVNIGCAPKYKNLFGEYKSKCEIHGFSNKDECMCKEFVRCNEGKINFEEIKDPVPTLFIQDEMHLVNESLGTFSSHYESFLQYYTENLIKEENRKKIKYIGATATISKYESQINNLYYKNARKFPCDVKGQNFYSYRDENDITRCILGFATHGRSVTDGVQYSCTVLRILIQEILDNYEKYEEELKSKGFSGEKKEIEKVLNDYWISIVYNTSKNDSNELAASFENQGNILLTAEGISNYNVGKITGNDSFKEIKDILIEVEDDSKDKKETTNLILATSSISHGVDEDSFNQIFFFGMPKNTAEYIQAYSRVGRKYTGIVIDIIRLAREKDRSYLKNFNVFHDYKNKLIEQVPINRWAKNAIYNTLPGVLNAFITQYLVPNGWFLKDLKKKISETPVEEIIKHILNVYNCSDVEPKSRMYEEVIKKEIKNFYDVCINETNENLAIKEVIAKAITGHREPMINLRDVDVQLELDIKR